ncbi:MAG: MnmC family methyltransferase [Pseudomonadota bacterium]|nr:MnmC family methyltransferase [Pseudomonadota bacterium]
MDNPKFEIVTTTTGAISIRNIEVNEIMHNPVGPWIEANALYIDQSNLKQRLTESATEELVVFDVGLGAAANALAAISCARTRALRLISFERDLELLKFAHYHTAKFEHFRGFEGAIEAILTQGYWSNQKVFWELRQGEFLETIATEVQRPHLIFFDPYSPNVNQEMWTSKCFEKIRRISRELKDGGTSLYTYSQATRVRVALINAGFFVGYGKSTGLKTQTTEAATDISMLKSPLDKPWYDRWQRSNARYPYDCKIEQQAKFDTQIEKYFSNFSNF